MANGSLAVMTVLAAVYLPQAVLLAWVDGREQRLPNRQVAVLTVTTVAALTVVALVVPELRPLLRSGLVLAGLCAVAGIGLALIAPMVIGMGDAKTAPVAVLMCAALGPHVLIAGALGVALLGGAAGAVVWAATRRADARFAFGPTLLAAPCAGLVGAPAVAAALGT